MIKKADLSCVTENDNNPNLNLQQVHVEITRSTSRQETEDSSLVNSYLTAMCDRFVSNCTLSVADISAVSNFSGLTVLYCYLSELCMHFLYDFFKTKRNNFVSSGDNIVFVRKAIFCTFDVKVAESVFRRVSQSTSCY
jgi:hypothetical protein